MSSLPYHSPALNALKETTSLPIKSTLELCAAQSSSCTDSHDSEGPEQVITNGTNGETKEKRNRISSSPAPEQIIQNGEKILPFTHFIFFEILSNENICLCLFFQRKIYLSYPIFLNFRKNILTANNFRTLDDCKIMRFQELTTQKRRRRIWIEISEKSNRKHPIRLWRRWIRTAKSSTTSRRILNCKVGVCPSENLASSLASEHWRDFQFPKLFGRISHVWILLLVSEIMVMNSQFTIKFKLPFFTNFNNFIFSARIKNVEMDLSEARAQVQQKDAELRSKAASLERLEAAMKTGSTSTLTSISQFQGISSSTASAASTSTGISVSRQKDSMMQQVSTWIMRGVCGSGNVRRRLGNEWMIMWLIIVDELLWRKWRLLFWKFYQWGKFLKWTVLFDFYLNN